MGKYLIFGAISVVLVIILFFSRYWLNKREITKTEGINSVIRQPKAYLYVGIGGIIIFVALGLFFLLAPESMIANYEDGVRLPVFFMFIGICCPYSLIILLQINWKIEIGEHEFTFKNMFGKKRIYQFEEVEVKLLSRCTRFYKDGKHIVGISYLQPNWDALEKAIQRHKRELKKNNKKLKSDQ